LKNKITKNSDVFTKTPGITNKRRRNFKELTCKSKRYLYVKNKKKNEIFIELTNYQTNLHQLQTKLNETEMAKKV